MQRTVSSVGILLVLGGIATSGCATSLQPLASKDVRVDFPEIAGNWVVKESNLAACQKGAAVKIVRLGVGRFDVETKQDGKNAGWDCETIQLGKLKFVDIYAQPTVADEEPEASLRIGTHAIFLIEHANDEVRLIGFDLGKLEQLGLAEQQLVASPRNDRNVFVADTKRLQAFFAKHASACAQKGPTLVLTRNRPPTK